MLQNSLARLEFQMFNNFNLKKVPTCTLFHFLTLDRCVFFHSAMVICSAADGCHYVVGTDGTRSLGKISGGPGRRRMFLQMMCAKGLVRTWEHVWELLGSFQRLATVSSQHVYAHSFWGDMLLMEQITYDHGCIKPVKQWDKPPTSSGVHWIFPCNAMIYATHEGIKL